MREVAREILGNQLHVAYVVDPKVQASITAQTGGPLPRDAVLPTLESVLRSNGLALMRTDGVYRILPLEDAAKAGVGASPATRPGGAPPGSAPPTVGYGIRILPLKFVSAGEIKSMLDPFVPPGGVLQADGTRNLLIVSGPSSDLDGFASLVSRLDVDWMKGTSFAIYPLRIETAQNVAAELAPIFGEGSTGPTGAAVRIVPLERLNAILVIASDASQLREAKTWIDRLDYGEDEVTPRLFQYRVQNSRATDLAGVLSDILGQGQVRTPGAETAPGTSIALLGPRTTNSPGTGFTPAAGTAGAPSAFGQTGGATASTGGLPPPTFPAGQSANATGGPTTSGAQARRAARGTVLAGAGGATGTVSGTASSPEALETPPIRVVADEKNNALVVYARPRDYRMIEGLIRQLDIVPLQVLIEATIAEVTLNDALRYGLQFFLKDGASRFSFTSATSGTGSPSDITGIFPGFNYVLSSTNARVLLSLLSSISNVNVISSPQILVLDHQTAALLVGDQVPIVVQSAQSVINPDSPIVNSIQYRNTGVVLQVTPRVNTSGLVTLDIDQEVSDVARTTSSTINSPTISQRRIASSVVVQDGETVALGGLIRDNQTDQRAGIPVLSSLPLIGPLFRDTQRATTRTELLVLLEPRIVRDPRRARELTDELRDRLRSLKPLDARLR